MVTYVVSRAITYIVSRLDLVLCFSSWARLSSLGRSRLSFLVLITFVLSWGSHVRRLSCRARTWNVVRGCRYNVYFVTCPWYLTWRHIAFYLLYWICWFIWLITMVKYYAYVCRCRCRCVQVQCACVGAGVQVQLQVWALLSFALFTLGGLFPFFWIFFLPLFLSRLFFGRGEYCMIRYVRCGSPKQPL